MQPHQRKETLSIYKKGGKAKALKRKETDPLGDQMLIPIR